MEVMKEDKQRVELLLKKFKPRILRLAVNFISDVSDLSLAILVFSLAEIRLIIG